MPIDASVLVQLRRALHGDLLTPDSPEFEQARRVWNGLIDRKPAAIARCEGADDVREAIAFARENDVLLSVRGGGHNIAGLAICDGGLTIDLSRLNSVRIDPQRRLAYVGGGASWAHVDRKAQAFGLATTGGMVSTTGVGGLTLGGGLGWLMRRFGLTCDTLRRARVVTANGNTIEASEEKNSDLFWALRGGGGNFGVVTEFEFALHPITAVVAGAVFHRAADAGDVLRFFRQLCDELGDSVTMMAVLTVAPPAPFIPPCFQGEPLIGLVLCDSGSGDADDQTIRRIRSFGRPIADTVLQISYERFQSSLDASAPPGLLNYSRSLYMKNLSDGVIDVLAAVATSPPTPLTHVHVHQLGGAVSRADPRGTAYRPRDAAFLVNLPAAWTAPEMSGSLIEWTRTTWDSLHPFGMDVGYVNYAADVHEAGDAYGPEDYGRLVDIKTRYDPANVFRMNHNIRPAPSTREA